MDIHPPHQPVRNWKDFLVHLLTITVGLCIALALEAAVEVVHHRHLVRDARENLRREIEQNHKLYVANVERLRINRQQLARDMDQLRVLREGKRLETPDLHWSWSWDSYADAAWRTARESGAILYMDTGWISTYSWVYAQQDYVNSTALSLITDETKARAPLVAAKDVAKLTPAAIESLLINSAEIDLSIANLEATMKSLDDMYARALAKR